VRNTEAAESIVDKKAMTSLCKLICLLMLWLPIFWTLCTTYHPHHDLFNVHGILALRNERAAWILKILWRPTMCGRKVLRLATLCTNRKRCCHPLHMAVRLNPVVDSVQAWTCYNCYAIVESVWREVVFVRCVTKMDRQKLQQRRESATVAYKSYKGLMENVPYPRHKSSDGTNPS
jgi:hypothetical protein